MGKEIAPLSIVVENLVLDRNACGVEIGVWKAGQTFEDDEVEFFTGVSKRIAPDKFDPQLGYELAFWRAVEAAAAKELKLLEGQIKHKDDIREDQANKKPDPNRKKK